MGLSSLTLGIANRISQISDLQFEICHLRCRRLRGLLPPGFTPRPTLLGQSYVALSILNGKE